VLHAGDGLELEARYYNDTDETISEGLLSTDEMMILFGLYYEGEDLVENDKDQPVPNEFGISKIYPNPFNPSTTIRFNNGGESIKTRSLLQIFDINGRVVETLVNGNLVTGEHEIIWNASGFSSGIYFVRLQSNSFVETQKIVLVK
jgi:hypothetical protein